MAEPVEPRIEVLGVYKPSVDADVHEWGIDEKGPDYWEKLVLIEALAHDMDGELDAGKLGQQPRERPDPNSFLCCYDEGLLSTDGETLISRDMGCVRGTGCLRFAFYLEFYDATRPLSIPYGAVGCPAVVEMPARLEMLMPFNIY
jgi:hypothetical protein